MRRLPAAVLLLSLFFSVLYSQTPVFKSSTRLVTVNAVVQGKDGLPLTGLTKSNFQLLDNGEAQQIAVFSESSTAAKSLAAATPDDPQPLPDVFSNRVPPTVTARSNVTVVLLDALNTDLEDQSFARDQVIRYLRQIQPGDHIGLYALGSGLTVLHDFTTDSSDLLAAVQKYGNRALSATPGQSTSGTVVNSAPTGAPAGTMSSMTASQNSAASDPMNLKGLFSLQASTSERDYLLQNRIVETLNALTFIAEHLAVFPGRKSLVWVSGGFPLSVEFGGPQSFSAENHDRYINTDAFKRCMRIVNAANIAIYPVDAHGVSITGNYAGASTTRPDNSTIDIAGVDQQQTMRLLASRTGGKAFINRNDLSRAIGEAVGDSAVSYTLGFYPTHQNSDGTYHKITLKLDTPHADLRYREGYFDVTRPSQEQNARLADLTVAAASPIDANGISLTAQVLPGVASGKRAAASALQVTVQINPRTITLTNKDGLTVGLLDILFVQHDKAGRSVNVVNNSIDLKAGSDELAKIRRFGILFNKDLERAQGAESLRIIVRDVESGSTGSLTVPFSELKSTAPTS